MIPLVSISCITYNHEKFIAQALDGFVMQQTSFPVEILIYDDASTDNTQKIIHDYEAKFPDIIRPIYQNENQFSKGVMGIAAKYNLSRSRGKYIAMCEGDDYWTDPLKLQKQVDFLETNQSFALVYHNMYFKNEQDNTLKISDWPQKPELTVFDLAVNNYIYTASVVFKRESLSLDNAPRNIPFGDYLMWLIIAKQGRIKYFDEPMGVYRIHPGGVWSTLSYPQRQAKTLKGKKLLMEYFKNDEIEGLLAQSYIDLAFASLLKIINEGKPFRALYFLYCVLKIRKGRLFLINKVLSKF